MPRFPVDLRSKTLHEEPSYTVPELFMKTVNRFGNQIAFRYTKTKETAEKTAKTFAEKFDQKSYSWNEYNQMGRSFAKALINEGIQPGQVVTIQGSNSPEWLSANMGTILAGGVSAGVYTTNSQEICTHIVENSQAAVVVVEDESQLKKYQAVDIKKTAVKCFVVWNKIMHPEETKQYVAPVYSFDEFVQKGASVPEAAVDARIQNQSPQQPCSLIYTSGTTGNPKGATLTHDNLTWTALQTSQRFGLNATHHGISYLPLSHIAAQQLDCLIPLAVGQSIDIAPKDALKGENLKQHLLQVKPTYFLAVPRVWEKLKEGIETKVQQASFFKKMLFRVSTRVGKKLSSDFHFLTEKKRGSTLSLQERIRYVFEKVVLSIFRRVIFTPIKKAMGLDQCTLAASGASPLSPSIARFFAGLDIHIIDLFGMSESSGPATFPSLKVPSIGTCGQEIPGTQVRIFQPDEKGEGEILLKGRNVFQGYWANEAATKEVFDSDGFFHTGDKGKRDQRGNLILTGRIKELIKTSGGENIPPIRIEQRIKRELPIVSQAVVVGDQRKYLTCLLTLKTQVDKEGNPTDILDPSVIQTLKTLPSSATTLQDAAQDPAVQWFLIQGVKRANQKADSQAQHIQNIQLLPEELSVVNGALTPTLKLKRSVVENRYHTLIDKMYSQAACTDPSVK